MPLPKGWNRHHALYYRRWYQSHETTRALREHGALIVPMSVYKHDELHRNVSPLAPATSDTLVGYMLRVCDDLDRDQTEFTHLEAFTTVRDELEALGTRKRRLPTRKLGDEALRFAGFFDRQLDYMTEPPR